MKTRRAPSRHRKDARVHGHTTTAKHDIEYTPPSALPPKVEHIVSAYTVAIADHAVPLPGHDFVLGLGLGGSLVDLLAVSQGTLDDTLTDPISLVDLTADVYA